MFNVRDDQLPGFRVKAPEQPGFRVNMDRTNRRIFNGGLSSARVGYSAYAGGLGGWPATTPLNGTTETSLWSALAALASHPYNKLNTSIVNPAAASGLPISDAMLSPRAGLATFSPLPKQSPATDPVTPVADVPRAANDNSVCNRANALCRGAAQSAWAARSISQNDYLQHLMGCQDTYELCLQKEEDPQRIGTKGDYFDLPDGSRLIFRRGNPPVYIPSPKATPAPPRIPPDYNDPTQFD